MVRIFESLLEESGKKRFIKKWLGDDTEKVEEYDRAYEEFAQIFDNEVKKRGLNWQTSMNLEIFEEILSDVKDRKAKTELKKQNKDSGKSAFLSYVLANPDCDLTHLGTLCKWDYFKINTWPGAMLADSPKASLKGDTGARWCIGWRDPTKQKFDQYTRDGYDFVLIVKSDNSNKDEEEKYCIQIQRKTGAVVAIWTPIDKAITNNKKIGEILYGQEFKTKDRRISGILKGIDVNIDGFMQPENRIVNLVESQNKYIKLYESGTDQLINDNDVTALEFIKSPDFTEKLLFDIINSFQSSLVFVKLPQGLKRINKSLFKSCNNLFQIEIPDSVTLIDREAFYDCERLESIRLPQNLKKIGHNCFYNCRSLRQVEIPDSVTVIKPKAFYNCTNLGSVKLPVNLKELGFGCFSYCRRLGHIEIPDSVKEIGLDTFFQCTNLESIKLPASLRRIGSGCFSVCVGLRHIELPDSIVTIDKEAFYCCGNLESIRLPQNLKKIWQSAFAGCKNLKHIEIPDSVNEIWYGAFNECTNLESIKLPAKLKAISGNCLKKCTSLKHIEIPNSVKEIGNGAFDECTNLESIRLPKRLKKIGNHSFSFCPRLKHIEIPDSVEIIEDKAFRGCISLESIKLSANLKKIGEYCFEYCENLKHIEIPDSVEEIGNGAFYNSGVKKTYM